MLRSIVFAGFLSLAASSCVAPTATSSPDESVGNVTQAMSRCGYPPKRPWPTGCVFRCECTEPVNAPFGEDPADYHCFDGTCHLEPRADCAFVLECN
jgi:hypothetical protein